MSNVSNVSNIFKRLTQQQNAVDRRIVEEHKKFEQKLAEKVEQYVRVLAEQIQAQVDNFIQPIETLSEEEFKSYLDRNDRIRCHNQISVEVPKDPEILDSSFREKVRNKLRDHFKVSQEEEVSFSAFFNQSSDTWVITW